jgi:hypothetical protein
MLEIKESNSIKIGKLTKTIIDIKKTKSELTTNDLLRIRNKILKEGKKKHKHCEIQITKVLSHQWFTYTNETKFNEVASKINERIDPFKIVIRGEHVRYLTKNEPTDITLKKSSDHYLRFADFKFPAHKDYIPIEKTEHARKKTFYLHFDYDIYNKILTQFKNDLYNIYNQQKYSFKITFEFSFLLVLAEGYREISDETKSKLESKCNFF